MEDGGRGGTVARAPREKQDQAEALMKPRLRDLGIVFGDYEPGPYNAITDVPGVTVGQVTLVYDEPRVARTGVTVIMPRAGHIWRNRCFAGFHALNGTGEMTGIHWLRELGMLTSPVALTNTHEVGLVRDALVAYGQENGLTRFSALPVVAETWDGRLNDMDAFHLRRGHVYEAIAAARSGPVAEGNVGGGTGMICHDFKGGIGTASRRVPLHDSLYTVGALVQANHGDRADLRVDGVPVGRMIGPDVVPVPDGSRTAASSLIVVLATDAPLLPVQCRRLAQRATIGMARNGGIGHNGSGDLFLAFATGNDLPPDVESESGAGLYTIRFLPHQDLNPFFSAVAEAVEEAILNCLVAAETMTGYRGMTVYELPVARLRAIMDAARRRETR
jgi:D-aminopeptidase